MEDKQFNLQLTIQKLEEELSLYRNGTTGAELMELIHEKDNELKEVKSQLQESSKELNVLKNNFNTLIKSSKKALNANEMMKTEQEKLSVALQDMTEKYNHTSATLLVTQEALGKTEKSLEKVTEELEIVTKRAEEDEEKLRKLQEQSIGQVKKLNSQYSQIKDYEKDLKILESKLQKAEVDIWKDKEKITELQLELRDQTKTYLQDKASKTETITAAHGKLLKNQQELKSLNEEIAMLKKNQLENESSFKHGVVERDDMIRELKRQVEHLEKMHAEYLTSTQSTIESREAHWKSEVQRLQKVNEFDAQRVKKLESERSTLNSFKREMDTLKARNQELEDKIKRQEQYMKNRLLKDRGNILNIPEGTSKPKHSYHATTHGRGTSNNVL